MAAAFLNRGLERWKDLKNPWPKLGWVTYKKHQSYAFKYLSKTIDNKDEKYIIQWTK
jgi:hypothetical protein